MGSVRALSMELHATGCVHLRGARMGAALQSTEVPLLCTQVPQYQKKTGRYQKEGAKQYGRARALLGLLVGTKMRPPVLGAWCAVAPGRLGPTRKPSEQDSKKNTGEHLQRLPRHADAASLGASCARDHSSGYGFAENWVDPES